MYIFFVYGGSKGAELDFAQADYVTLSAAKSIV